MALVGPELKALLLLHRHIAGHRVHQTEEVGVAGVVGVGEEYLIAGIQQAGEDQDHGRGGAGSDDELLGGEPDPILFQIMGAQGLPELNQALGMGVLGLPRGHGPPSRLLDHLRGGEVGLANLQMDDVLPPGLQLLGSLEATGFSMP